MARVTYGSGITELAGSIGGVTYQKNASGNIAKLRSNPIVNPTSRQAVYQRQMAMLVAFWPTLSQFDKDAWNDIAAAHLHTTPWGESKKLSGYQWFLSCNLIRLRHFTNVLQNPYAWTVWAPPPQFTIEVSATYIRAAWVPDWDPDHIIGYISLPLKQSSLKLRRSLFYVKKSATGVIRANLDFTTEFEQLCNVTWADFYASANCYIIIRIINCGFHNGYTSAFTSAIIKIN